MNTILDNIPIWITAQTQKSVGRNQGINNIHHHGIKRLRELILELAVRGKLVPQDPDEEPASVLLKKIAEEKEQLTNESKIKKQKVLPEVGKDEKPFELPNGWACIRFGNISVIERGGSPRPIESYLTTDPDGLSWIKIGDTEIGGKYISSTKEKIRKEGITKTRMVYSGDFLLTNSMSFGRPYITLIDGCIHDGWLRIHPPKNLDKDYLYYLLSSPYVFDFFRTAAAGAVVMNLNSDKVRDLPLVLPPIFEQSRIAAKVDELMALCDKLEQQQTSSLETHQLLVETLFKTLADAKDTAELNKAWQQIGSNFGLLFTTEESVDLLKQTILQLAVMGKLTQDFRRRNPELVSGANSALELSKKIAVEKEKLIAEGKIKKQNPLPDITDDEKPFELPEGWKWERLGNVTTYGITDKAEPGKVTPDTWILELEDIEKESSNLLQKVRVEEKDFQSSKNWFYKGDVVYGKLRPYLDKVIVADENGICTTEMMPVRGYLDLLPEFLRIFMKSKYFIQYASESTHGMNLPRLGTEKARLALIPVLSITEQHRIVAKVDEFYALCDALKLHIDESQEIKVKLADTVIEGAVK